MLQAIAFEESGIRSSCNIMDIKEQQSVSGRCFAIGLG
jgi:hypothetical protein